MGWTDWLGTASYTMLAASYVVTNIFWLRLLAIVALTLEGVYFYGVGEGDLWVAIAWVVVFVAINLVQLGALIWSRAKVRMSEQEHLLQKSFFADLDKVSLRKLTSRGSFRKVSDGTVLLHQGHAVEYVAFLLDGRVHVFIGGDLVEIQRPPDFLGEISFLTGKPSTVTAVAIGECRLFIIGAESLRDLAQTCEPISAGLHREFALALAQTLQLADALLEGKLKADG